MPDIEPKKIELETRLFTLLGQPTRLRLLYLLRAGELCVCKINPELKEDQSVISRHLIKMRDLGLLTSRREGVSVYYKIAEPGIFDLLEQADGLLRRMLERQAHEAVKVL